MSDLQLCGFSAVKRQLRSAKKDARCWKWKLRLIQRIRKHIEAEFLSQGVCGGGGVDRIVRGEGRELCGSATFCCSTP